MLDWNNTKLERETVLELIKADSSFLHLIMSFEESNELLQKLVDEVGIEVLNLKEVEGVERFKGF